MPRISVRNALLKQQMADQAKKDGIGQKEIGKCYCGGAIMVETSYKYSIVPTQFGTGKRFVRGTEDRCFCAGCGIFYNEDIVAKKSKNKK
jgi:hypothetical protein